MDLQEEYEGMESAMAAQPAWEDFFWPFIEKAVAALPEEDREFFVWPERGAKPGYDWTSNATVYLDLKFVRSTGYADARRSWRRWELGVRNSGPYADHKIKRLKSGKINEARLLEAIRARCVALRRAKEGAEAHDENFRQIERLDATVRRYALPTRTAGKVRIEFREAGIIYGRDVPINAAPAIVAALIEARDKIGAMA